MQTAIQKLFNTCKDVFSDSRPGFVPSPAAVKLLGSVLDDMKPSDLGLRQSMPYFRSTDARAKPPVTYMHLYECDKFSMGIFCLPQNAVIPLHNHPGMTVFSKILFGSMHIKSYDWATTVGIKVYIECECDFNVVQPHEIKLAKVKANAVYTAPCDTSILYPAEGGNIHCFTAVTPVAVLDVLGPPYSEKEGRDCTYYSFFPYPSFSGGDDLINGDIEGHEWLEERKKPEDFIVVGARYKGPKFVEK
ncbi:hypothetical protein QJS04_geneDACA021399 [Acorus gramineus]|uniref:cysteine dioxygenase n=1 Tax=Acorus gramineus TaxID=55184 RepID=A0AAV9A5G8_ACOGR|nr:hypothetical protein QJS04_geneDACA005402 [Acorus gramineus]KAK1259407.1 hypothetical protein QJS04_geneDACA021399 [Acorus gramineus]